MVQPGTRILRAMRDFIQAYPLAAYFSLAVTISWAVVLAVILPGAIPASPEEAARLFVYVYLAMLTGPPIAGITLTAVCDGTRGLAEYRRRLARWRVNARWYAVALLTAPFLLGMTLLVLWLVTPDVVPGFLSADLDAAGPIRAAPPAAFITTGIAVGIGAGFFEELGWTGFATPRALQRRGVMASGLVIGLVWGAWHFLAILWGGADARGSAPMLVYLSVALFSFLPPYRVLMTMVYERTRSLPVGITMHATLTASMIILGPAVSGTELVVFDLVFGAMLWATVLVAWTARTRSSRVVRGVAARPH